MPAERKPKVGMANAFITHYPSGQVILRFLQEAGADVIRTPRTTPEILQAATTLASADFCIPLRVYVGHIYYLLQKHPDLDFLVAPAICRERRRGSACSKYRDPAGVAVRSITGAVPYTLSQARGAFRTWAMRKLERSFGGGGRAVARSPLHIPPVLAPNIWSLEKGAMRNVCLRLYADIFHIFRPEMAAAQLLPAALRRKVGFLSRAEAAFEQAYAAVVNGEASPVWLDLSGQARQDGQALPAGSPSRAGTQPEPPRLALIGREYLLEDPLVTSDIRRFFRQHGVQVITPRDVPETVLEKAMGGVAGFYESHQRYEAFIKVVGPLVDGVVLVASFGCHPDGFMMEYLLDQARALGRPAWLFRYDEQSGSAGFLTRYETVLGFLEARRDERVKEQAKAAACKPVPAQNTPAAPAPASPKIRHRASAPPAPGPDLREPLIIWPYMNEIVDLTVEELFFQAGLARYLRPPAPATQATLALGDIKYTETCSPFAITTGSLRESVARVLAELKEEARRTGQPVKPRRIIMLQGRGEGPCTYGWYAIAQAQELPQLFAQELAEGGHTLEMASVGFQGVQEFLTRLAELGDKERLKGLVDYLSAPPGQSRWRKLRLTLGLARSIWSLARPTWAKLKAAEDLRARSLILRAHEVRRGDTTARYQEALDLLRQAHTLPAIRAAHKAGVRRLESVPRDHEPKPRVVAVGEIYVALSSFANRGTVENLMGREGLEVVEGVSVRTFLRFTLLEFLRRFWVGLPGVRQAVHWLARHNIYLWRQQVRGPGARPFLTREVGGDGLLSVAEARHHVEDGADGIVHMFPFKCMPEGIAKDALTEMADFYGVRYLPPSVCP
ncbi:MAG: hypothetical protein IMW99_04675 [Firmicutes bacterium]|nr:hypothetical protein [Bacillota bacterium]